jgi:hypothetical protein
MIALRWLAVGIAMAAIWDPALRMSRRQGPPVDIVMSIAPHRAAAAADLEQRVHKDLTQAGFRVNSGDEPAGRIVIADRAPSRLGPGAPIWAVDMSERRVPNIAIARASVVPPRPGQSVEVRVLIRAAGAGGQTTDVQLEQHGIVVASSRHTWGAASESWTAVLHYLPPADGSASMVARARPLGGEATLDDNVIDVRLPPQRPPIKVFAYDANVTWSATFVRRGLEGEPAVAFAGVERASQGIATRTGAPPAALSAAALSSYDAVIVGSPEELPARDVDVLRWFIEVRGGVVAFIPQRNPSGAYRSLLGVDAFGEKVLEHPVALEAADGEKVQASELIVSRDLPAAARPLLTFGKAAEPIVFSVRRGAGAVIFFGAMDAWRYRAADRQSFARFWRRSLLEAALTVAPRLAVDVEPAMARPGEIVTIRARLRTTELQETDAVVSSGPIDARVVGRAQRADDVVRLWPGAEPGVFAGRWSVPAPGDYDVSVSRGDARADATVTTAIDPHRGSVDDPDGLALLVRASGGEMLTPDQVADLGSKLNARFPARPATVEMHPMRSAWWILPFSLLLCAEWTWRRINAQC